MCREAGGRTLIVVTDVTREDEVMRLAEATLAEWGRIDVWVNNAGITLFARVEDGDFAHHRRVIETNLFGAMYGARAVVPIFRRQGYGTLINIGSVLGEVGQAFVPTYSVSKFALRGLSEALRVELADTPEVHVCTVLPFVIDTPHFDVAANLLGRQPHPIPPVQSPEDVARAVVDVAARPRRHRHVPRYITLGLALHALMPNTVERLLLETLHKWHLGKSQPRTSGNLDHPVEGANRTHGKRAPLIGTARFFIWAGGRFLRLLAPKEQATLHG